MKKIFTFLLLIFPATSFADPFCEELKTLEAKMNAESPQQIDEFTELVQVIVNCETDVVSYKKRILVAKDLLPAGAQERKQRQHTQLHCNKRGLASKRQWTAMDVIFDQDYKYIFTLETTPGDCNN